VPSDIVPPIPQSRGGVPRLSGPCKAVGGPPGLRVRGVAAPRATGSRFLLASLPQHRRRAIGQSKPRRITYPP